MDYITPKPVRHEFCDECDGCKPSLADPRTMKPFPNDSPEMVKIMEMWENDTNYAQRKAYIEMSMGYECDEGVKKLSYQVIEKIKTVLEKFHG